MTSLFQVRAGLVVGLLLSSAGQLSAQELYTPGGTVGNNTTNGNVGVATSAPNSKLHVNGLFGVTYDGTTSYVIDNSDTVRMGFYPSGTPHGYIQAPYNKSLFIWNHGTYGIAEFKNNLDSVFYGNVGAGTNQPAAPLHVFHASQPQVRLQSSNRHWAILSNTAWGSNGFSIYDITADVSRLQVDTSGNIGIGTTNPGNKLHLVVGTNQTLASYVPSSAAGISDFASGGVGWQFSRPGDGSLAHAIYTYDSSGGEKNNLAISSRSDVVFTAGSSGPSGAPERMRIAENGNVGIGTATPSHKLSVNGTIKTKEIIVETTGWADDVFADGYQLKALGEVEAFIAENMHLPDVPSAAQVVEHGVAVGEMQATLLRKIEELTLYVIAQEKRHSNALALIDAQAREIEKLKSERAITSRNLD